MKPWKSLTIADDYMFWLVMRNPELCKRMLEIILGIKILKIRYVDDEKTFSPGYFSKGIRLDVYVEGDDSVFDVEMQMKVPKGAMLPLRMRYYQSTIDTRILYSGEKYTSLRPCYIIFICPTDPFDYGRHIYTFESRCIEDTGLALGDRTRKIFLNASGTMDDVTPELKAFLDYVKGIPSEDEFVCTLDDEIRRLKAIERERGSYMTFEMKLDEMREEGLAEGLVKGRAEGLAVGFNNAISSVVTNLLKIKFPYEKISEVAGTPIENVIRIAKDSGLAYS